MNHAKILMAAACVLLVQSAGTAAASAPRWYDESRLSQPVFQVRMEHNVRVPMRDGVTLSVDIYRPDAPGRFPVLLWRTPYSNNTADAVEESKWYAARGYAVVAQDVRGKYDSDGEFYAFRHEADDGYDTDEWIAAQPWSNGRIGTTGGSYSGYTQLVQAIRGNKHVVALTPQVSTLDVYNNWIYVDGALHYGFAMPWGAVAIDGRTNQYTQAYDWPRVYPHLPVATADEAASHRNAYYRDWVKHPARDRYWDGISFENDYDKFAVPMLEVDGWYDIFLRGALKDHVAVRAQGSTEAARKGTQMVIGPWEHYPVGVRTSGEGAGGDRQHSIDFTSNAVLDVRKLYLRWFDYWLKGIQNGVPDDAPLRIFVMGANQWRDEHEWPLARTRYTNYYIGSGGKANSEQGDGVLGTAKPHGATHDGFTYDPASPVPSEGGNVCCSTVPSGPHDQRPVEERSDVLVYSTPPLRQAVEVTGPIVMKLFAASSAPDTDWTAKLVDVHPDGYLQNIQDGIVRARYRQGVGKPAEPIKPGKVYEYSIDLWATSNVFLPGHRIRLEISSSNFPRFDRNPNTGEDAGTATRVVKAQQTIYHSSRYPSHLILPIIAAGPARTARNVSGSRQD